MSSNVWESETLPVASHTSFCTLSTTPVVLGGHEKRPIEELSSVLDVYSCNRKQHGVAVLFPKMALLYRFSNLQSIIRIQTCQDPNQLVATEGSGFYLPSTQWENFLPPKAEQLT